MKIYTQKQFLKTLKKNGYEMVRRGKGSHSIYSNGINTFPVNNAINPVIALKMIKTYSLVV